MFDLSIDVKTPNYQANDGMDNIDFGFFTSSDAKNIDTRKDGGAETPTPKKKRATASDLPSSTVDGSNPASKVGVADVDYSRIYEETNGLIRGAIMQTDQLSAEIKEDIDSIRASKTLKNKYTYITNLTTSASNLINTKISAIKELNSSISNAQKLELDRVKALKVNDNEGNDDMKMMELYNSFINTPIGTYAPTGPSIQDITVGGNQAGISSVDIPGAAGAVNPNLTPEQNRMRMESNPNIQVVVRYDQGSGQRCFDVIDKMTGMPVPNYPRPDNFLLEDTIIDVHNGIARNRNINQVWPLMVVGQDTIINEY